MQRIIGAFRAGWMKIGLLLTIAAVPLAGETFSLRLLLFVPCWAAVAGLGMKWFGLGSNSDCGERGSPKKIELPLGRQDRNLRQMIDQLKGVIQQTEQASLVINERFMNIAGRAKRQLRITREIVSTQERDGRTVGGADADVATLLEAVTLETNMLASDINNIIESLQFQDITRQHIEHVIAQIQELLHEVEQVRQRSGTHNVRGTAGSKAEQRSGPGEAGMRMQRTTDEGRSNGEDFSDR